MKKHYFNQNGMAISGILYTLLILFLALLFGILGLITSGKTTLDKLKQETYDKLNNFIPNSKICRVTEGTGTHIGDEITCGTESFYVYDTTGDTIKMLSKYNLKVGGWYNTLDVYSYWYYTPYSELEMTYMQDANMRGWVGDQTEWKGTTDFSSEEQHGEEYSSYEGSIVEGYVDRYKEILTNMGVTVQEARLITKEELVALGCNEDGYGCSPDYEGTAPEWVYSTSYWSGSASNIYHVWIVFSTDGFFYEEISERDDGFGLGVRPVIIIPKSEI